MKTVAIFGVRLLGVLGLSLAILYVTAVAVAFIPGFSWVTNFLVGPSDRDFSYMFLLASIPYVMLTLHLYLRTVLGGWLLRRGWALDARRYAEARLDSGLLRSKREAQTHRVVLGQALIALGELEEAEDVLAAVDPATLPDQLRLRFARWRLEGALRREDLISANTAVEAVGNVQPSGDEGAAFWACRAELAARKRDRAAFDDAVQASEWGNPGHPRLAHARAVMRFRTNDRGGAEPLARELEAARATLDAEVPGRASEVEALIAFLRDDKLVFDAKNPPADADGRARHVLDSVARSMEYENGKDSND